MLRTLSLVAVLLLAVPAPAADGKATKIIWHGQSFFEIVSKDGTRVVLDPHAIEAFGRQTVEKADLVLCSHNHNDHTQLDVVGNIKDLQKENRVFVGTKGDGKKQEWVKFSGKYKDVTYRNVPTFHDDVEGMRRGKNSVIVLEVDGLRIVHLGDLGHPLDDKQIEKIGEVDVLLVPIGGVYTLAGFHAKDVVAQLKPKRYILPMHYGVPGYDELLTLEKSLFLDKVDPSVVKRYPMTNELDVDSSQAPPKEPIIVLLNWEKKAPKER